jgi:hypothetical protein
MSLEAHLKLVRREGEVREPIRHWIGANFARLVIYLSVVSFVSAVVFVIFDFTAEGEVTPGAVIVWTGIIFFYGGLFALPGALLWLLIVSRLSPESSTRRRRTIAMLAAPPLIGIAWILIFGSLGDAAGIAMALIYGVLLPAGSGLVVTLRRARRPK